MSPFINPAKFGRVNLTEWRGYAPHYTEAIWPDVLPSSPQHYGDISFHGRTHPEIIYVALERYTRCNDVVWDCFAGGGTTIDVCEHMGNRCIANDINPTRSSIIKADSRVWKPDEPVDMVICHPPYMDIIPWEGEGTLAVNSLEAFLEGMEQVFDNIYTALKPGHVLVLIVGQVYKNSEMYALDLELWPRLWDRFRLLGRVVRGFGETKGGATSGARNENLWRVRRFKYGIWSLGIDVVLWLQKI
jgi:hypothetical protein